MVTATVHSGATGFMTESYDSNRKVKEYEIVVTFDDYTHRDGYMRISHGVREFRADLAEVTGDLEHGGFAVVQRKYAIVPSDLS